MKYLNTRVLGIIGIIGAPWAFIDFMNNGLYERFNLSSWSGVRGFIFITGWLCSIIGLYRLRAMGTKRWQKNIMIIQVLLLFLANCWNVIEIINPEAPVLQSVLTAGWPVAGVFMVVTGIVILQAKQLTGWTRYVPLLAGLWLPQTMLLAYTQNLSITALVATGIYATVVFTLLGLCLIINPQQEVVKRRVKAGTT